MFIKKQFFILLFVASHLHSFSQEYPNLTDNWELQYKYDISKVAQSRTIVYFGLDFTFLNLNDPKFLNLDEGMSNFSYEVSSAFEQRLPPSKYIKKWLKKKGGFTFAPDQIQDKHTPQDPDWISRKSHSVSEEDLKKHVSGYSIKDYHGLGLVLIPETFNKTEDFGTVYYTFFDIDTKEVLWIAKYKTPPSGYGIGHYWAGCIHKSFKHFIDGLYRRSMRKYK